MGYSRNIRGVFTGYSYVSVMYRLCVGYVSVIYRNILGVFFWGGFDNLDERNRSSCSLRSRNLNKSYYNATYSILRTP